MSDTRSDPWRPIRSLPAVLLVSAVAGVVLCLLAMRIAVGGSSPGTVFGLSESNHQFAVFAGTLSGMLTSVATWFMHSAESAKRQWSALGFALALPVFGAFAFFLFLIAGLG